MKTNQIFSISLLAVAGLSLVATTNQGRIDLGMTEQCVMASMGYQYSGTTKLDPVDKYALPEPFYAEPVATYKLTQQYVLPSNCNTYLAGVNNY